MYIKMIKKRPIVLCLIFLIILQIITSQSVFAGATLAASKRCDCEYPFIGIYYGGHVGTNHDAFRECDYCGALLGRSKTNLKNCNLCYTPPTVNLLNLSESTILTKNDTDFKLQMAITDNYNRGFKCTYILNDSGPSSTIIAQNTIQTSVVTFTGGINATKLKEGLNKITIKLEILDSEYNILPELPIHGVSEFAKIINTYFYVDFGKPVITNCSATSTQNSINISTQIDSLTPPIEYKYTIGSSVSNWLAGQNSYNIGNLNPNTIYTYKVEAKDSKGRISLPYSRTISTKAQAPVITAQTGNNNTIKIDISDKNPIDSQYKIKVGDKYLSNNGILSTSEVWITLPTKNITAINLVAGTQYGIIVYVKEKGTNNEVASTELNIKTTPIAPMNLRSTNRTKNSINLAWDISAGAYVYDILRETVVNNSVIETKQFDNIITSSYTDTALLENQLYRYKIRSKSDLNTYGNWSENALDITTLPKESAKVEGLKADIKPSEITLSWKAQVDAIGYEILLNQQQRYYSQTNEIHISFTEANAQYLMKVRAYNICDSNKPSDTSKWSNQGEWSDELISYTLANAPKNIEIRDLTFDKVQFTWDKNNNPDSVSYKCSIYKENTCVYESNEISTNTYSFSGLEPQTQYTVKIHSINSNGIKSFETAQSIFTTKIAPPEAPKQLRSSAKDKEITLSWEQSERATSYMIIRDGVVIASNIEDNKFFDKELTPDTVYTYEVISSNESGEAAAQIIQKTKAQAPFAPSGIELTRNNTYIQISWNSVDGAEGYDIKCDGKIYNTELNTYFEHNGLDPGSSHTYNIRTRTAYGKSEWSEPITVTTIPKAPVMPDKVEITATQTKINIKWEAVLGADSYVVNIDGVEIIDIKIPEYTYSFDGSFEQEQEHIIRIIAVNEGGESGYTAPQSIKLLPKEENVPELTGKVEGQAIYISWNDIENALGYEIEIDSAISTTVSAISTEHIDVVSDLTQSHTYRVRAILEGITGEWSYPLTIKSIPAVPTGLLGIPGQNFITLKWNKCDTASTYELSADGNIIYIGPNTEFTHSSLPDDYTFSYSVRAVNGSGYSTWSEHISIKTSKEISNAPQNIKPLKSGNKTITISWDLVKEAKGYIVKINEEVKDTNIPMISVTTTPGGIYIVSVVAVFDYENNTLGEWSEEVSFMGMPEIPEIPVINEINTTEFSVELVWDNVKSAQGYEIEIDGNKTVKAYINKYFDSDVLPKTTKSYRIRSYNESGKSNWSEITYATTNESLPGAPTNILCKTVVATSGSAISIKWNAVNEAISYEITDSDNNIYSSENSETVIVGLKSGALYQFKVRALTSAGQGPWSSTVYYITDIAKPRNLNISNIETSSEDKYSDVKLNWESSEGAKSYEIEVDGIIMESTENNEITLKLNSYMTHSFRVRALNEIKTGEWTEELEYNSNVPISAEVEENEEFSIVMPVSNIKDISQYRMTIVINTDELELVDACEFTPMKELSTSYINNNKLQIIIENKENFCYITIFVKNETTDKISGIVNSIRVKGKKNCLSEIRYIVDKFQ